MNWLKNLLPKNSFARGVSVLVGGTVGSQALMILATPLITRLYTPEDFGLLAVFTAILAFFTVVSAGRYDLAIPLPEGDQDAANLAVLCICIVSTFTLLSFIFILFFSNNIALLLKSPKLANYLLLIPIGIFFVGIYQIFSKWSIRQKEFSVIAKTTLYQSLGTIAIQLTGSSFGAISLIFGYSTGQGIGAVGLARSAFRKSEFKTVSLKDIKSQAIRYKDFPIYSTGTALFNTASLQFAPIVFITLYGATISGLYALTLRILSMPISLVGNAIGSVFLSEAPKAKREGTLPDLIIKLHNKLALIGAFPLAILLYFAPDLFSLAFGKEWLKAGVYAQWMAPWIYLQLQWSPLSMLASVLELQRASFISQILSFSFRFGSLILAWQLELSSDNSILVFAIVSAIVYLIVMLWFINKAGAPITKIIFANIKYVAVSIIAVFPLWYIKEQIL
ncbi:oligosaccharide flippase family protein [Psychrobacter lutiphocae]|uniref:oligosaccharide flippase family protein n=1 Tax=Psychrobacter lutiphocae TaxID=540500 RepID=UPI00037FE20E|nr:oligosaccharide flippase family protein [Psychrobacter lutiphocae]